MLNLKVSHLLTKVLKVYSLFLSPSELNDIDSEDEEDTTKDYDSDEDLQVCYWIDSNHNYWSQNYKQKIIKILDECDSNLIFTLMA